MKKLEKNSKNNPVKSDVLTIRQVIDFVSDSNESLVIKVAVLIGGLRVSELVSLDFGDFEKLENKFNITVQFSKTDQSGKVFVLIINDVLLLRYVLIK